MTITALRQYMLEQGPSQAQTSLEWDKIWAMNKGVIDPIAPRHVVVAMDKACVVDVTDAMLSRC
jgi:glutamyl-tRNA synthetase